MLPQKEKNSGSKYVSVCIALLIVFAFISFIFVFIIGYINSNYFFPRWYWYKNALQLNGCLLNCSNVIYLDLNGIILTIRSKSRSTVFCILSIHFVSMTIKCSIKRTNIVFVRRMGIQILLYFYWSIWKVNMV